MTRRGFLAGLPSMLAGPKTGAVPVRSGDLAVLAWTMWGEARGESRDGQLAVAATVLNRVARTDRAFERDTTIRATCLRHGQFTCWAMQAMPRHPTAHGLDTEWLNLASLAVAEHRNGEDATLGSTHYHMVGLRESWTIGMKPTVRIGSHQFYRAPIAA